MNYNEKAVRWKLNFKLLFKFYLKFKTIFILILNKQNQEKRCNENIHTRHFAFGVN